MFTIQYNLESTLDSTLDSALASTSVNHHRRYHLRWGTMVMSLECMRMRFGWTLNGITLSYHLTITLSPDRKQAPTSRWECVNDVKKSKKKKKKKVPTSKTAEDESLCKQTTNRSIIKSCLRHAGARRRLVLDNQQAVSR